MDQISPSDIHDTDLCKCHRFLDTILFWIQDPIIIVINTNNNIKGEKEREREREREKRREERRPHFNVSGV